MASRQVHNQPVGDRELQKMAARPQLGSSIESLIATGSLRAVFQPIVDLETGRTIGHEGLARGPARR